ncbi:C40 family peptidase [Lacinutrix neustonica]|uniref:C40 family peptidase n=1 Tax=Lacinutrix neustonica TaxID=2980107 RepID=A0A9E8MTW3_9FLAO|nr:C40 family peptidase [Lacinutrix neustonica]WAC01432.1 C40 family peptidase [Lacinutrix neustonica]
MKLPKFTSIELLACFVLGILMAYFFAIPTAISLYTAVFHVIALSTIFYFYKQKRLKPFWYTVFSFLSILFINSITTRLNSERETALITLAIIHNAENYEGTQYKYGGTTKKGMDCSGLIRTIFKEENIALPRASSAMAQTGEWIAIEEVKAGDLLFFRTRSNTSRVNHVGLVTCTENDAIEFIHSTTSQGVITSKLSEKYWYFAFVQARRVL